MARRQDGVSAPETRAGRIATSVRMTLGQESWRAMRKAITAALEGDLIRGSRRRPGTRWGGRSVHLSGAFGVTHERRDLPRERITRLLRSNARKLWNLLGTS
jgi:hypothetical protein